MWGLFPGGQEGRLGDTGPAEAKTHPNNAMVVFKVVVPFHIIPGSEIQPECATLGL